MVIRLDAIEEWGRVSRGMLDVFVVVNPATVPSLWLPLCVDDVTEGPEDTTACISCTRFVIMRPVIGVADVEDAFAWT